jgi:hypothetical protein
MPRKVLREKLPFILRNITPVISFIPLFHAQHGLDVVYGE